MFGAWTSVLVYFLGKRVASETGARAGGLFAAIYPSFVFYSIVLMTDMLFFLFLLLAILQGFRYKERPTLTNLILLAALLALTTLTRSIAIVAMPISLMAVLLSSREGSKKIIHVLAFVLVAGLLFGLWMGRNYRIFHEPSLLPTKGAYNLWDTMACLPHFIADKEPNVRVREQLNVRWDVLRVQALYPNLQRLDLLFLPDKWNDTELQRSRQLTQRTVQFMLSNPLFSFIRYLKISAKMYLPFTIETESRALQWGQSVAYVFACLVGFWSYWRCRKQHRILDVIALSLLIYGLIVPFYSLQNSQRSRMPFDIMLIWLAAFGFQAISDRYFARK